MRQSLAKRFGAVTMAGALLLGSAVMLNSPGTSAHEGVTHPAHIHTGTCPAPGEVVFPLNDAGSGMMGADGSPAAMEQAGSEDIIPVDFSDTTVQTALADILDGNHAIVVHESADNMGNYILCGNIGGMVMGGTDLAIGLGELNDSGAAGVAYLHDNGDGTTDVKLFVTKGAESEAGTPTDEDSEYSRDYGDDASSDSGASTDNAVAVSIKDFSFGDPIEVAVGTTVTWTNEDSVPHTVTDNGEGGFQSGKIDAGGTFSFTFTEAGTYDYYCEYHANMKSTVTVK